MQNTGHWQVKGCMERWQARERTTGNGDPVITPLARNDLFLFRPANGVVVIPDQFDLGIVCIAAGQTKEDTARIKWRHLFELFCQQHRRLVGSTGKELRIVEFDHLLVGDTGQFFLTVANGSAPKTRHAF